AQEARLIRSLGLLTRKPVLYVANVDEHELEIGSPHTEKLRRTVERYDPEAEVVEVCARLEADLLALEPQERLEFLAEHGMTESGLARLIRAGFRLLGLRTFFTVGDNEVRAWTLRSGALAPHAAGRVHSDFERGFIRAETVAFDEFRIAGSMKVARERGLIRSEGKEYEVRDGDILLFRTSA
nr:DUF933 domain-containing protein [Candidatus Palauibacterales bacterium]